MRNLLKNFNFKFLSIGLICSLLVHSVIIFILFSLIKTKKSQEIVSFVELVPYSDLSSLPELDRLQEQHAVDNPKIKN